MAWLKVVVVAGCELQGCDAGFARRRKGTGGVGGTGVDRRSVAVVGGIVWWTVW